MENYENKLLGLVPNPTQRVTSTFRLSDLMNQVSVREPQEFEKALHSLVEKLPFSISKWPSFDAYIEDWF